MLTVALAALVLAQSSEPPRTRGELGESCRAALDCRAELRCVAQVCVARPTPTDELETYRAPPVDRPEGPRSRLRLGLEASPGFGVLQLNRVNLVGSANPTRVEEIRFVASLVGLLELGLEDDQLLLGLGGGVAYPAGVDGREPSLQVDLRAGWRVWRGSPSVGFYLEPRVEGWLGGVPGDVGLGGALAAKMRVHWLDAGIRVGGATGGEGTRRIDATSAVRESLTVFHATFFLAVAPVVAAW